MLSDIANAAGTTGGQPVAPCMLVMTGKSSYDPDSASTYGGSTGIALQMLDLWEQQNTTYDAMWALLETDLQTAINNIMGNQQLAQNGSSHATAVRSVGLDEYSHKQFIQLGGTYFVYRQTGFSIDCLPFDSP